MSQHTERAYQTCWKQFESWCQEYGFHPLPAAPEVVALFLTHRAKGAKWGTIGVDLSAIARRHRELGVRNPRKSVLVTSVWKGLRKVHQEPTVKKKPLRKKQFDRLVSAMPDTMTGARDRALLELGWCTRLRRGVLVGLQVGDLFLDHEKPYVVTPRGDLRISAGAVFSLWQWLQMAGIQSGPVFRNVNRHGTVSEKAFSAEGVARVVKKAVRRVGWDPSDYSSKSLWA